MRLALSALLLASTAHAADICKTSPQVVEQCRWIQGAVWLTRDGVAVGGREQHDGTYMLDNGIDVPANVGALLLNEGVVTGAFEVCPFELREDPNGQELIPVACVNAARDVALEKKAPCDVVKCRD